MSGADDDRFLLKREFDDFIEDQWKPFVQANGVQHQAVRDDLKAIGTTLAVGTAIKAAEDKIAAEKLTMKQTRAMVVPTWVMAVLAFGSLAATAFSIWKATGH